MLIQNYRKLSNDYKTNEYLEDVLIEYEKHFRHAVEVNETLIGAFNNIFSHLKNLEPKIKEQKSHHKKQLAIVNKQLDRLTKEVTEIRKEVKWNRKNKIK